MVRGELSQQAEIARQVGIDHHSTGQPERAQDLFERFHRVSRREYVCGVSVNLSGTPDILANLPIT